nr:hypothetical protein GCM10017745_74340 [Saccharothrix mutabilis subsp. capreolus]
MGGEPAVTGAQQLVHFVLVHPVVLAAVEHGQQDVEVLERVGQQEGAGERDARVARVRAVTQRDRLDLDRPAQRREQPLDQGVRQHGDPDAQRDRRRGQLGARLAAPVHGRAEDGAERDGEQRAGHVRPVVDVLGERAAGTSHQRHGVHFQQERDRALLLVGAGVEDVRGPRRGLELLRPVGVLVQEVPQVGGRLVGRGQGQQHAGQSD